MLVSPLIPAGSAHRVPDGATPFDHTSILATVEHRWGLAPLTRRDAAAPDVAAALSLPTPRTDDPLAGIAAPTAPTNPTGLAVQGSHLQQVQASCSPPRTAEPAPSPPTCTVSTTTPPTSTSTNEQPCVKRPSHYFV